MSEHATSDLRELANGLGLQQVHGQLSPFLCNKGVLQ